ncbi:hypothetical protein HYPSUDRAFT_537579 [Hypholoma sublateritium FD-334 SS-4]|uniref:Uncharacterized protein n=1 Tax=Hypholoma sublateritium (strain FD-334 SS-4) TaxID=945553 RepID=A0A0D2P6H1_HYPSF|nr:hypothetical protein HYPSUDRAFT_537579 [Hypholoma sublateritium FD-334 SS-4]
MTASACCKWYRTKAPDNTQNSLNYQRHSHMCASATMLPNICRPTVHRTHRCAHRLEHSPHSPCPPALSRFDIAVNTTAKTDILTAMHARRPWTDAAPTPDPSGAAYASAPVHRGEFARERVVFPQNFGTRSSHRQLNGVRRRNTHHWKKCACSGLAVRGAWAPLRRACASLCTVFFG